MVRTELLNHYLINIPEGESSVAYYAKRPPECLIIFVHGLGGSAVYTWDDFNNYVRNYTLFGKADVIFYGYDSKTLQAASNAAVFEEDLQRFVVPPTKIETALRENVTPYKRIIFVAHSLGAIVVRRALLFAYEAKPDWLKNVKLLLMAPAHLGSHVPERVMQVLPGLLKVTAHIARHFLPVIEDLQRGSEVIENLKAETKQLLNRPNKPGFAIADKVVWSVADRVVINERFCKDPKPITVKDKNHVEVCKPDQNTYPKPLEMLIDLMK